MDKNDTIDGQERQETRDILQLADAFVSPLTELGQGYLRERSVGEILRSAKLLCQIREEGERFLTRMQEVLAERASAVGKESVLQKLRGELSNSIAQCQEESPDSPALEDLIASLGAWRQSLETAIAEIEAAVQEREAGQKYRELYEELKVFQAEVRDSQQLERTLSLELREALVDLQESLQPDANLAALGQKLDGLRSKFKEAALNAPQSPPQLPSPQPPLAETAVPRGAKDLQLEDRLRRLDPIRSDAIAEIVEIQKQAKWNGNHEYLVNTINSLLSEKILSAVWLKAMLAYSYLEVAYNKSEPLAGVLDSLASSPHNWLKKQWNVEASAIRVSKSLEEFAASRPSLLAPQDFYDFFSRVQEGLGNSPHYRVEIILSRICWDWGSLGSSGSKNLQQALSHIEQALVLKPNLQEAVEFKQKIQERMREFGVANLTSDDDEDEDDESERPLLGLLKGEPPAVPLLPARAESSEVEQRREIAARILQQAALGNDPNDNDPKGTKAIELILKDYMSDPEVGPWLAYKLVKENQPVFLDESEGRNLVERAKSLLRQPSVEMFLAEVELQWGKNQNYRQEGGLEESVEYGLLEDAIRSPATENMQKLSERLRGSNPWCALACFDCLAKQEPDRLEILWYFASIARDLERPSDYFESALLCLNEVDGATPAEVANGLLSMKLDGLALAVAETDSNDDRNSATQRDSGIVRLAANNCFMEPWQWPLALQEAREKFDSFVAEDNGNWIEAADGIIRAMLASPTHWASCRAFFEIFTHPGEDDRPWGDRALELALAVLQYLNRQPRFREQPELLVLEAELRLQRATLEEKCLSEQVRSQCDELCTRSLRTSQGFLPAIELQERLRPDPTLSPGERLLNRYQIIELMPKGSFGQVYKAQVIGELWDGKDTVALKQVYTDALTPEKRQQRFRSLQQEAEIALKLNHPHIVKTHEFIENFRCLVMEFIDGDTVWKKIDSGITLPWEAAALVGRQIADALNYAKQEVMPDFAHRDIHPGNIILTGSTEKPHAKLLDFGLARLPGGLSTTVVMEGVNRRMIYRAPDYGKKMDFRSDMFALGVILYELIARKSPYPIDKYLDREYKSGISGSEVAKSLRPLRELLDPESDAPKALGDILAKMVAFKKDDRYKSWDESIADLDRLLSLDLRK